MYSDVFLEFPRCITGCVCLSDVFPGFVLFSYVFPDVSPPIWCIPGYVCPSFWCISRVFFIYPRYYRMCQISDVFPDIPWYLWCISRIRFFYSTMNSQTCHFCSDALTEPLCYSLAFFQDSLVCPKIQLSLALFQV